MKPGQRGEENCKKPEKKSPNVVFGMEIAIAEMMQPCNILSSFFYFLFLLIFCHVKLITEK
jgi:hypothetical protein